MDLKEFGNCSPLQIELENGTFMKLENMCGLTEEDFQLINKAINTPVTENPFTEKERERLYFFYDYLHFYKGLIFSHYDLLSFIEVILDGYDINENDFQKITLPYFRNGTFYHTAVKYGGVSFVKWLVEKFGAKYTKIYMFTQIARKAIELKEKEIYIACETIGIDRLTQVDIISCLKNHSFEILDYLYEKNSDCVNDAYYLFGIEMLDFEIIKWLRDKGLDFNSSTWIRLFEKGENEEFVMRVLSLFELTEHLYACAVWSNNVKSLEILKRLNCPYETRSIEFMKSSASDTVRIWLISNL